MHESAPLPIPERAPAPPTRPRPRFGEFLARVQRESVQELKHGRVVGVIVSAQDHEAMLDFYANRLQGTLAQNAASFAKV